jgi:hypothetical protein
MSLNIDVSFLQLVKVLLRYPFIFCGSDLSPWSTERGILHVGAYFGLYVGREEVPLDCGDASRGLGWDEIDSDDAAAGRGSIDGDLGPRAGSEALRVLMDFRMFDRVMYQVHDCLTRLEELVLFVQLQYMSLRSFAT